MTYPHSVNFRSAKQAESCTFIWPKHLCQIPSYHFFDLFELKDGETVRMRKDGKNVGS